MKYFLAILTLVFGLNTMAQEINIDLDKVRTEIEAKKEADRIENARRKKAEIEAEREAEERPPQIYFTIKVHSYKSRYDEKPHLFSSGHKKVELNCQEVGSHLNVDGKKFLISSMENCEKVEEAIHLVSKTSKSVHILYGGNSVGENGQRLYDVDGTPFNSRSLLGGWGIKRELQNGSLVRYGGRMVFQGTVLKVFAK